MKEIKRTFVINVGHLSKEDVVSNIKKIMSEYKKEIDKDSLSL